MSEWYVAGDADISLDTGRGEVNILVTSNAQGNVYVALTWDQLDAIAKKKSEWMERMLNDASAKL